MWGSVEKLLSGEFELGDVRRFYKDLEVMEKVIFHIPGGSKDIILIGGLKRQITMPELVKIAKAANILKNAMEKLSPDLRKVWELSVLKREHYIDVAIMCGMSARSASTMKKRVLRKINKAESILYSELQMLLAPEISHSS